MPIPSQPAVPPAQLAGVVTDQALVAFTTAAEKAEAGAALTDAEATVLCMASAAVARELLQWRRRAELARDVLAPDNVLMFPGVGGGR